MAIAPARARIYGALRLERWPRDPSIALIAQRDHHEVIDPGDLDRAVAAARAAGYRRARTSAVFAESAAIARRAGFGDIDTLVLLSRRLEADDVDRHGDDRSPATVDEHHRVRTLWPIEDRSAAAVDLAAFGPVWGSDRRGLASIRGATPRHWAGAVGRPGRPVGFVIVGIGTEQAGLVPGFIQRLAVEPGSRRQGIARSLLGAALRRLRDRHVTIVSVNTGIDNRAALDLYRSHRFTPTDRLMYVGEIDLGHRTPGSVAG